MWADPTLASAVRQKSDSEGYARCEDWTPGAASPVPHLQTSGPCGAAIQSILKKAEAGDRLSEMEITHLFSARGGDFLKVCESADRMRRETVGDDVTFIVNRNVNYTNVCSYHCQFCAFSKGKSNENLRGQPYVLTLMKWPGGHAKLGTGVQPRFVCRGNSSNIPVKHI